MWNEFLNESRSQNKFENNPLIILGNKHSGKRSLIESLFEISKTTIHNKKLQAQIDANANKMKLKGLTTAIDYAYLNVIDLTDIDYRTHTKLQVYMVQNSENPTIYSELAKKQILKKAVIIIMLDFTNPWNFVAQINKWIKFIYQLQKKALFTIVQLQEMKANLQNRYKKFKQPQFDQNDKLKKVFQFEKNQEQIIDIALPDGVLSNNIRLPLLICVNKCDLQSQVFRDQSTQKIMFVLYHLRKICIQYGASLIYTSIKNNSNLNLLYEYTLKTIYGFPFRFKTQAINEQAIFIPLGYDNNNLINDSVMKMDVSRNYQQVISAPVNKKTTKQQIAVQQQSKYFEKYVNIMASSLSNSTIETSSVSSSSISSSINRSTIGQNQPKTTNATIFFKSLLTTGTTKKDITNKVSDAEKCLEKHTKQVMKKKQ